MRREITRACALLIAIMLMLGMVAYAAEQPSEIFTLPQVSETPAPTEEPTEEPAEEPAEETEPGLFLVPKPDYTCGLAEHTHTDACYVDGELTCGLEEHAHDDSCLAQGEPVAYILDEPNYKNLNPDLLECGNEAQDHIHSAECCKELDFFKYLGENLDNEWTIKFIDPDTGDPVEMTDGYYVFEKGKQYKLSIEVECDYLAMGRYYIEFPENLDGSMAGSGRINNGNANSRYYYDEETGKLWFFIEDGNPAPEISAGFYLTFDDVIDDVVWLGNIRIKVENSATTETTPGDAVEKQAYADISAIKGKFGDKGKDLTDNLKNIGWYIKINRVEGLANLIIIDKKRDSSADWYFSKEDQERGLVMEITVDGKTYLADIDGSCIIWDESSWTATLPAEITVRGLSDAVDLTQVTECRIYFTSTIRKPLEYDGIIGAEYKNQVTVDNREANATTRRHGGHGTGLGTIDKNVATVWEGDQSISWTIKAVIPGWQKGMLVVKDWAIKDETQLRKGSTNCNKDIENLLLTPNRVTVKTGSDKPVPYINEANVATSEFAWGVEKSGDSISIAMVKLYHRCDCENLELIDESHVEINGYCTYWTAGEDTTFIFEYKHTRADIEEIYGIAGEEIMQGYIDSLYNSATLMHSKNSYVDRDSAYAYFPPALTKTLIEDGDDKNLLHFTITINEGHRMFPSDLDHLLLTDKMCVGLSLVKESVNVTADGESVNFDVSLVAGRENEFELTIEVPKNNPDAMYVVTYSVEVDQDELRSSTYANEVVVDLFGTKLTRTATAHSGLYVDSNVRDYALKLIKQSDSGAPLKGAEFTLYEMDVPIAEGFVTDDNGIILFDTDSVGTYLLQHRGYCVVETQAPKGFKLDNEKHWFMFCRNGGEDCLKCAKVLENIGAGTEVEIYRGPEGNWTLLTGEMTVVNRPAVTPTPVPTAVPVVIPTPAPTEPPVPTETPEPTPEPTPTPEPDRTNVTGHKTWNDNDNAGGTRPEAILVRLLQDGVVIEERRVTAADGWSYSFDNLLVADEDGNEYTYTVSEQLVSGYYGQVDGYNLINTLIPFDPNDPNDPDTTVTFRTPRTPLGIGEVRLSVEELADLIELFGYGTPLWGGLLPTGDVLPVYPFIFAGIGIAALAVLFEMSRRKRSRQNG